MTYPPDPHRAAQQAAYRRSVRLLRLMSILLLLVAAYYIWPVISSWFTRPQAEPRAVTPRGDLMAIEKSTIALFKNANPSVVYITTLTQQFNPFTRRVTEVRQGTGSGFLWDDKGHVVTNYHVIQGASGATVVLHDHAPYRASLVGVSPENDLAVLRITVPATVKLQPIPIGTSHDLQVGQSVFAIGNPFGLDQTLTTGVISALKREITGAAGVPIEDVIQTDAAINPGNSGGVLLDSAGRLIGVNTAIYSPSGSSAGIGFAIPVDTANRVVPQIIAKGSYRSARLGIQVESTQNLINVAGLIVLQVEPGSPADRAGLKPAMLALDGTVVVNDIVQKLNGKEVRTRAEYEAAVRKIKPGDNVSITLWRDNRVRTVLVQTD